MAELADALDLGSSAFGCGGSSPPEDRSKTEAKSVKTLNASMIQGFFFSDFFRRMHGTIKLFNVRYIGCK